MREAEFIQRVFREAAPIVLGGDRTAERKDTALGVYDVVTDSDVRTEEYILSRIAEEFPGDSIISEETHPDAREGERCWVLERRPIRTPGRGRGAGFWTRSTVP